MIDNKNIFSAEVISPKELTKFVFVRLLYSVYTNKLSSASFLKQGIELIDSRKGEVCYNHANISTSLTDNFYGLTYSVGKPDLKYESLTNIESNPYLSTTNPHNSLFAVYGLPITDKEYLAIDRFLKTNVNTNNIKYDFFKNGIIGIKMISNKLYNKFSIESAANLKRIKGFVCSSFVASVIYELTHYKYLIDKSNLQVSMLSPNGCQDIPGIVKLFEGRFENYNKILSNFISKNKQFNKYI